MRTLKFTIFVLSFFSSKVYANIDVSVEKTFGNIQVIVTTGDCYEEINKAFIIGKLAQELSSKLNYKNTILLYFDHDVGNDDPEYFVSFDDGLVENPEYKAKKKPLSFLKRKTLVIREISRKFDPAITLNIVEYAIINLASIKTSQKPFRHTTKWSTIIFNSIDTSLIRKMALNRPSNIISEVLSIRVDRPGTADKHNCYHDISYYFQNNKFHIFYPVCDFFDFIKDSVLLVVDNMYQFQLLTSVEAIVFDTDSTFYWLRSTWPPSKSLKIKNKPVTFYQLYEIKNLGSSKVAITFKYYTNEKDEMRIRERTLIYRIDVEELVQDLDQVLTN